MRTIHIGYKSNCENISLTKGKNLNNIALTSSKDKNANKKRKRI